MKYPTQIKQRKLGNKLYVMEVIRDLDEAIDLICDSMTPDEQLDPFAEDLCPYFGILWPAAEALAQYLNERPELVNKKKVLELGCGLGFPSMVATHLGAQVLATDFHPDAQEYLQRNCRHSSLSIAYQRLNWREDSEDLGKFDVVMGSDILYESKHPREVARGLIKFLKPGGTILLTDPGRNYLQYFIDAMKQEGYQEEMTTLSIEGKENFIFKFINEYTE
ncbi:MAG: methyltransferase domain-containing protein [Bacteriovoracaceae bacterium]|nr:methyltransferase domain-containing protein [Bacteriovoracaceae bacterium]